MSFTVDVPGAFESFFTGTGCYAGQPYSDDPDIERGARELRAAWIAGRRIKRGKGHSIRLELPSVEAACVLVEYAEICLHINSQPFSDSNDHSEKAAASAIMERVAKATEGRVRYDGWSVYIDDRRQT